MVLNGENLVVAARARVFTKDVLNQAQNVVFLRSRSFQPINLLYPWTLFKEIKNLQKLPAKYSRHIHCYEGYNWYRRTGCIEL